MRRRAPATYKRNRYFSRTVFVSPFTATGYDLKIEDKYRIARTILTEILNEGLVTLEKYSDSSLESKIETITTDQYDKLLNNPYWWYPCNEILSIELTNKGSGFLDNISESLKTRLYKRWGGKKQKNWWQQRL